MTRKQRDRWDRRDRSIDRPSRPVSAGAPLGDSKGGRRTPSSVAGTQHTPLRPRDARRVSSSPIGAGLRARISRARSRSRSRRAHCPPARARRIFHSRAFAGHLSERAREARATRRSETRVKRARGLERVFVRSFTGETRVERARARGERGESSVGGVQWFRGGPS